MPRDPMNNPTERIGRILDDIDTLDHWADSLLGLVPGHIETPPRPTLLHVEIERAVRQRTLGQVYANRRAQRRFRDRGIETGEKPHFRARQAFKSLSPDQVARIEEEIYETPPDIPLDTSKPVPIESSVGITKAALKILEQQETALARAQRGPRPDALEVEITQEQLDAMAPSEGLVSIAAEEVTTNEPPPGSSEPPPT